jgi:hypothetical protein
VTRYLHTSEFLEESAITAATGYATFTSEGRTVIAVVTNHVTFAVGAGAGTSPAAYAVDFTVVICRSAGYFHASIL